MFVVPALAASDESRNSVTLNPMPAMEQGRFKALQEMPSQSNEMSDTESAQLEGGISGGSSLCAFWSCVLYAINGDSSAAANSSIARAVITSLGPVTRLLELDEKNRR